MSEFKHSSSGRWSFELSTLFAGGEVIGVDIRLSDDDKTRITSAVNACDRAGLSNEALDADVITDMVAIVDKILWSFPDLDEIIGGQSGEEARQLVQMAKVAHAKLNR